VKKKKIIKENSYPYINEEFIAKVIEEILPSIFQRRPDLKYKFRNLFDDLVKKNELIMILEEIKKQREDANERFAELRLDMNKRFEITDKRFEAIYDGMKQMREDFQQGMKQMREEFQRGMNQIIEELQNGLKSAREDFRQGMNQMREGFQEEMKQMREDFQQGMKQMREEFQNGLKSAREDFQQGLNQMREEFQTELRLVRQDFQKELKLAREDFKEEQKQMRIEFKNAISAIGSRWGEDAEAAFREAINLILKDYFNAEAKEFYINDEEGIVKGYPASYQVDLVITNSYHIIIEIKAQANDFDVNRLHKLGRIYEKQKGIKPRLILLACYAREEAYKEAEKVADIEIITSPKDFKL